MYRGKGRGRGNRNGDETQDPSTSQRDEAIQSTTTTTQQTPFFTRRGNFDDWKCVGCEGTSYHKIDDCSVFIAANVEKKWEIMALGRFCWVCMCSGHRAIDCDKLTLRCTKCGGGHNTILHMDRPNQ